MCFGCLYSRSGGKCPMVTTYCVGGTTLYCHWCRKPSWWRESGGDDGKWNILNSGQTENYNPEFSDSIAKFAALHTNQPMLSVRITTKIIITEISVTEMTNLVGESGVHFGYFYVLHVSLIHVIVQ
mgnify:CR=1 FL=1